ncbi:DUF4188 domain-containing protein [Streptomyces smaragdinus]|nr:DUF4188 domain-containing protein [Streptomyces smaragdinus]
MNAENDRGFVLFLVGMRINKLWKIHRWWPALNAMPKLLAALGESPDLGLLGARFSRHGRTITMIQYWENAEKISAFAKSPEQEHRTYWKWFNRAIGGNGDVGIWHELYEVRAGAYEARYVNMPPFGLGAALGKAAGPLGVPD